jgi:acetyl-CoA synthetase
VGEPLNPEAVIWSKKALGITVLDNWWQTETGGIMISNYRDMEVKPGSMGKPVPGIEVAIAEVSDTNFRILDEPGQKGQLVIRKGWPSMFRAYLNNEARYLNSFRGNWYLSGDLAMKDEDGYFWFIGRADDIIKTSGHMVGPFEVESALMEHPAVAESAVVGIPDPMIGEKVKAFVVLKNTMAGDKQMNLAILAHCRKKLGPAIAPKEIVFVESLPRTRSGKIMRRLLKARELGQPEGDISTLE